MNFGLIHSPLVGPTTWRWVADELRGRGHSVTVPSLTDAASNGRPADFVSAAAAPFRKMRELTLVGHSGAGPLLPLVAARLRSSSQLVFVDAAIPPCAGEFAPEPEFLDFLRGLAREGTLPPWSTWWGDGAMESLVPDADRRAEISRELPRVPLAFYESALQMPDGWCDAPGAFVLLSESYGRFIDVAAAHGWPVAILRGAHLDIVNRAKEVADALLENDHGT